jgi:hypothetical protein
MTDKIPILVYAFHAIDCCGGFDWAPDTPENRGIFREALANDLIGQNYNTGTLVALSVLDHDDRRAITECIEGELQDAIEVGTVGRIIARFSQFSEAIR